MFLHITGIVSGGFCQKEKRKRRKRRKEESSDICW
jgi:hypothetical protein